MAKYRLYPIKAEPPIQPTLPAAPSVTVDQWFNQTSLPKLKLFNLALIAPFLFFTQIHVPNVDTWYQQASEPVQVAENHNYITIGAIDTQQLTEPERATPDKWLGQYPDYIFDKQRNQYQYPFWVGLEEEAKEEVEVDTWHPHYPDIVFDKERNQYLYPSFAEIDRTQLTQPERTTPDKWDRYYPDIVFDKERLQYTYPTLFWYPQLFDVPLAHTLHYVIVYSEHMQYQAIAEPIGAIQPATISNKAKAWIY